MSWQNPVIPGFHPDPSVCRVGKDYYLVTSSFNYFPGVPIFHSRDLVNWHKIGHCLTRKSQLDLNGAGIWNGIYAPTIRYHDGVFYMITTNTTNGGHFYVTTRDPAGEWSEPIWVEGPGFDPDLFWDDDDRIWFSREDIDGNGIHLAEIDIQTGKLLSDESIIYKGFEDKYLEAPHIYKINGYYYLLTAEGGTWRGHMVTCSRSKNILGPYEECPHNPILTHRHHVTAPIQSTGHADMIQAHDGSWYIFFLATRPVGKHHNLGRETCMAPLQWDSEGWPVVFENKEISLKMPDISLSAEAPVTIPVRDDFNRAEPGLEWNFIQSPPENCWSLTEYPGKLCLYGRCGSLSEFGPKAWLGRRQTRQLAEVSTALKFTPEKGEEAGLCVYMDHQHYYAVGLCCHDSGPSLFARFQVGSIVKTDFFDLEDNPSAALAVRAEDTFYRLGILTRDGFMELTRAETTFLSSETAGGFTGVYFGLFAQGNAQNPALFDWFDYKPL